MAESQPGALRRTVYFSGTVQGVGFRYTTQIVAARFNGEVTEPMLTGALDRLRELDFQEEQITLVRVPGAVELPVVAQRLAQQGTYKAIVCLGAVIRGETGHYDWVCKQASDGCQHVALQYDLPVIFGVITTDNREQAMDRVGGKKGHKGREAVDAAMETVAVLSQIE